MKNNNARGFTLIELLVVVLIIGILAAVALPQYKKAVIKSKLTQVTVAVDAARKGIDLYLLSEGYPTNGGVILTTDPSPLDIEIPGECDGANGCRSNVGGIYAVLESDKAYIEYESEATTSGNEGWFDYTTFQLKKSKGTNVWVANGISSQTGESLAIMCKWFKEQTYIDQDSVADFCN